MSYRVTTAESNLILSDPRIYANLPTDISFCPTVQIPDAFDIKDYELNRFQAPGGSQYGEFAVGVQTTKSETTRPVMSFRYKFEFNKSELAVAKRNNYDMIVANLNVGMQHMNRQIAQLLYQGNVEQETILGMIDVGEDMNDATAIAQDWDDAGGPLVYAHAMMTELLGNGYAPPYHWILSWNLKSGMAALHNGAADLSSEELIKRNYGVTGVSYADLGADALLVTNPLPAAAADDGYFIACAPNPQNFYMAQVTNGVEITIPQEINRDTNMFSAYMEWRGTPVFRGAAATTGLYITYENSVDLAT